MIVEIRVAPLSDNKEISFQSILLYHGNCSAHPMDKHRDVASNNYKLKCECGLELELTADGLVKEEIIKVAIGGEAVQVESSRFHSNQIVKQLLLSST